MIPAAASHMTEPHVNTRKISAILAELAASAAGERVALRDMVEAFGDRAFGIVLLTFSLPNAVGLGVIPGLSAVFGLPQIFVAAQMASGLHKLWLPLWLLERSVARADFRTMIDRSMPYLLRAERVLKPRLPLLTSYAAERLLGLVFVVLAVIVSLPIPFGNQPPGIAMAILALAWIERDGVWVIVGLVVAAIAVAIAAAVAAAGAAAIYLLVTEVLGV
jgi:hypothetical protein